MDNEGERYRVAKSPFRPLDEFEIITTPQALSKHLSREGVDDVNSWETVQLAAANSMAPLCIFRVHLHTREAKMLCKLSNLKRCLSSHHPHMERL